MLLAASVAALRGHVPVPESVLNPRSAPEAWNVLRLSTANVERLLKEDRLAEVPDQVSLCSPALRALPGFVGAGEKQNALKAGAVRASVAGNSLAQAGVAGDRDLAWQALEMLRTALHDMAVFFDPGTVNAEVYACPMHPEFVTTDPQAHCDKCGMPPVRRRIPYSFVYTPPGEPTLRLTATGEPLVAGQEAHVTIRLARRDGSPVTPGDLLVVHTQPIHLLIVDPDLRDYHHEHPAPTDTPGEYAFTFTPATSRPYRVFADLVPAETGVQEYPWTDLPGGAAGIADIDKTNVTEGTVAGLTFHLTLPDGGAGSLRAGQAQSLRISVATVDGKPMTRLEPVMAAFAHLVGFYEDGRTVVHLHPVGVEIADANRRGGPELEFKFYPPKPGFIKLFCQVQVDGKAVFAPFGVTVVP